MPQDNDKERYEKVGFLGQVPVLVIGNVNVGDYIVASGLDDGYAKAISPSDFSIENVHNLIGKAWSASTPNIVNYINVSVGLNNKEWVNIVKLQNKKIEELNEKAQKLEDLIKRVEKLETRSLEFSN
jgi:cell shape-determining protein MreC